MVFVCFSRVKHLHTAPLSKANQKHLLDFDWGLCFISADDEEREENGEQTAAGRKSTRQVVLQTLNIII